MALPSYSAIAAQIDVPICGGRTDAGYICTAGNHVRGFVDGGKVHWSNRMATREGIKRFLLLTARLKYPLTEEPAWVRLWTHLRAVWTFADVLGVRFPPRLKAFDKDKAHLRAMLVKVPTSAPGRTDAMAWASRR